MGTIKDRKSKDLTEGEDIKKRWQGYAEGLCKKILMTQKTMMPLALSFFEIGMKTDLYQFCGHCWIFQICWHIKCNTLTASSFRIWNSSPGIPSPPLSLFTGMLPKAKNGQITVQLHSLHMLAKLGSKFFPVGFSRKFQMYKLDLEKQEAPEINLPTSPGSQKIKGIPKRNLLLLHWLC